jgi:hypothetical protein
VAAAVDDFRSRPPSEVRVLVVGATGYIGKFVVRELVKRGYNVVAFARERSGIGGKQTADDVRKELAGAGERLAGGLGARPACSNACQQAHHAQDATGGGGVRRQACCSCTWCCCWCPSRRCAVWRRHEPGLAQVRGLQGPRGRGCVLPGEPHR